MNILNLVVDGIEYNIFDYPEFNEIKCNMQSDTGYILGLDTYHDQTKRSFLIAQYMQLIASEIQKNTP